MSEKSLYPPPSPVEDSQQYDIPRLGMEPSRGVPEERSQLEKDAWRLLDYKLLPFTAAIFLLAGLVSEQSDPSDSGVGLNVAMLSPRLMQVAVNIPLRYQRRGRSTDIRLVRQEARHSTVRCSNNLI
jgi:hypothetical protein